jgi:hypothetical protein
VFKGPKETLDLRAFKATPVRKVFKESRVFKAPLESMARTEPMVLKALREFREFKESKASLVSTEPMELKVLREFRGIPDPRDLRESREFKAFKDLRDLRDPRGTVHATRLCFWNLRRASLTSFLWMPNLSLSIC